MVGASSLYSLAKFAFSVEMESGVESRAEPEGERDQSITLGTVWPETGRRGGGLWNS